MNPEGLLQGFEPYLNPDGGIKDAKDIRKLSK
jgi:hypothetical protein